MFEWLKKKLPFTGTVIFRGSLPPRAEDFEYLQALDVVVKRTKLPEQMAARLHWALELRHPRWGQATLLCPRDQADMRPPRKLIEYAVELTTSEKETILLGESVVMLEMNSPGENILRERKQALHFLQAVMGADGLAATDHGACRHWSRDALDEELAHDADLDIEQIYTLHLVECEGGANWLHSHGLDKIGAFDFDVLRPADDLCSRGRDGLRALAFAIAEGQVNISTPRFKLGQPGPVIRFVSADEFQQNAAREDAALRVCEGHDDHRAVLCEPVSGLFARFSRQVKPLRFFSQPLPEQFMCNFSSDATELMARRARGTYAMFRQMLEELAEFEFPSLVKIGYPVDGGDPTDREHLWFTVNACHDDVIDATLINEPFAIARMHEGDRGRHAVQLLTDWAIFTPAGQINPRWLHPLRMIRGHRDELRGLMAAAKEE